MKYRVNKEKREKTLTWKSHNQRYLLEIQKFLDVASNIPDEDLQQRIIFQMLRCDEVLTELSQKQRYKAYVLGKKKGEEE